MQTRRIIAFILAFIGAAIAAFAFTNGSLASDTRTLAIIGGIILVVIAVVMYYYRASRTTA